MYGTEQSSHLPELFQHGPDDIDGLVEEILICRRSLFDVMCPISVIINWIGVRRLRRSIQDINTILALPLHATTSSMLRVIVFL